MKSYLINSLFLFISVSLISCISGTSEPLTYEIKPDEAAFVMLQLKSQELKQDSTQYQAEIKHAVDEVHKANVNLGYTQLEKKVASFNLTAQGRNTTYLVIRNFDDYLSAKSYALELTNQLEPGLLGELAEPFPISQSYYRHCMEEKDFKPYYKFYTKSISN